MSYLAAGFVIAASALAAGLVSYLVGRIIGLERRQQRFEFGGQVFSQVGIMFDPGTAFIAKPFSIEQLALKVREVLEEV